ncbi:hypothetical protein B0O99DRAFT_109740 [Bisporella sp. PMI_857]|nr:hypothetical protein B0O99DRAFT_109740 [Bisporella sp. PMI_857]
MQGQGEKVEKRAKEMGTKKRRGQDDVVELGPKPAAESTEPRPRRWQTTPPAQDPEVIWVSLMIQKQKAWKAAQRLQIFPSSGREELHRAVVKYNRKVSPLTAYDADLNPVTADMAYESALGNESHILLLLPGGTEINEELEASVSRLLSESDSQINTIMEGEDEDEDEPDIR